MGFWMLAGHVVVSLGVPSHVPHAINRIPYATLTYAQVSEHRRMDRPLIISDVPSDQSPCFGSLSSRSYGHESNISGDPLINAMLRHCRGDVVVERMHSRTKRKGLSHIGKVSFRRFLELWSRNGFQEEFASTVGKVGPVFAAATDSIRTHCKHLWRHLRFPSYFSGEMQVHSERRGESFRMDAEHNDYPTFYFSQKGCGQALHVDIPKTEIWTAVCRGLKRYFAVPLSVAWYRFGKNTNFHQLLRQRNFDAQGHWELPLWEGTVSPGEVLYLPAGSLHAIWSEEDTINIINNFVDVGRLLPVSEVNVEMLRICGSDCASMLEWLQSPARFTEVVDAIGKVSDPNTTARGFPAWGELVGKARKDW